MEHVALMLKGLFYATSQDIQKEVSTMKIGQCDLADKAGFEFYVKCEIGCFRLDFYISYQHKGFVFGVKFKARRTVGCVSAGGGINNFVGGSNYFLILLRYGMQIGAFCTSYGVSEVFRRVLFNIAFGECWFYVHFCVGFFRLAMPKNKF